MEFLEGILGIIAMGIFVVITIAFIGFLAISKKKSIILLLVSGIFLFISTIIGFNATMGYEESDFQQEIIAFFGWIGFIHLVAGILKYLQEKEDRELKRGIKME